MTGKIKADLEEKPEHEHRTDIWKNGRDRRDVGADDIQSLSAELGRLVFARQWRRAEKLLSESPSFEARVALAAMGQEDPDSADQLMLGASMI